MGTGNPLDIRSQTISGFKTRTATQNELAANVDVST